MVTPLTIRMPTFVITFLTPTVRVLGSVATVRGAWDGFKRKALDPTTGNLLQTNDDSLALSLTEDGRVFAGLGALRSPRRYRFVCRRNSRPIHAGCSGPITVHWALSMGNPHAILMVDDCDAAPVSMLGPLLEAHTRFPERVNVGFGEFSPGVR